MNPMIHSALHHIRNVVLEIVPVKLPIGSQGTPVTQLMIECYCVTGEPNDEDDPRDIHIIESEASQDIVAPKIAVEKVQQPLKIRKINIWTTEDPQFSNVGD